MAATGYTPISLYYSTTASAVPTAGNLVAGELAININDGKLYFKNSSNVVTLLASSSGASGDVVGPASATNNGVALFDGTTGKLLKNSSSFVQVSGDVGIGTISPSGRLHVATTTNTSVYSAADAGYSLFRGVTNSSGGVLSITGNSTGNGINFTVFNAALSGYEPANFDGSIQVFKTSNTERMRIASNGDVGIGANPASYSAGLTVLSANTFSTILAQCSVTTGATGIFARNDANTADCFMYAFNSASGSLNAAVGTSKAQPLTLLTNNTEKMRITSSGDVGIGTSSPSSKLEVYDASTAVARVTSGTEIFEIRNTGSEVRLAVVSADPMTFRTSNVEAMRIDSSGNVLVGTTTVSYSGANRGNITVGGTSSSILAFQVNSTNSGYIYHDGTTGGMSVWNAVNSPMYFATNNTERMRIDSDGNALFAKAVRATITTDNDLSFDMNAASNFKCTPTAGGALTFTNITSGQTGNIILVNNSNYAITAAATTKVSSTCLATISATGTYWLSYYSDGTNVYVANTGALA